MIASMTNVLKRYGDTTALDHLNLDITEGEILGLLGPNGAGKTTAIRTLCGLINADSGDITVFGQKQNVNNINVRKDMGLVTQEITVFDDISAIDNLLYFGGLYGLSSAELKQNVEYTLQFVGLTEYAKKKPRKFSGGMQRRLNIGCALVHKPRFLIMDEPTVGIDPQSRNHILESVKEIASKGTTVLYTSHYMEEVQVICSHIAIMDAGRVIADGSLDDLIGRIQYEDVIRLTPVNPSEDLAESIRAVSGVKSLNAHNKEYVITSIAGSGNVNRIMEITVAHGGVESISTDKPNLEDVFLTLTGKKLRDGGDNL